MWSERIPPETDYERQKREDDIRDRKERYERLSPEEKKFEDRFELLKLGGMLALAGIGLWVGFR